MAIQRPENRQAILREEIAVCAERVADRTAKEKRLIELLQSLNPQTRRAVVFVTSRRMAEELAHLVRLKTGLAAAPFHARLSTKVRLDTYDRFRDRDLSVLCATKAFGMGMDIDNIHLVIHFGPPSSLEDYLQEIGRAARKGESLQKADLKKATACLLYEPGDFRKMRDRLKNDFLSSLDLMELHNLLVDEWGRAGSPSDHSLSIQPGHLAKRLRGGGGTANHLRIGLYWLEKLERIKVGFYAPAQVEVEIDLTPAKVARRALSREARTLLDYLQRRLENRTGEGVIFFQARDAKTSLNLSTQNQLFVHLAELARQRVIRYQRKLLLPLDEHRAQESRARVATAEWPLLGAALAAVREIGKDFCMDAEQTYTHDGLKKRFETIAVERLRPEEFTWLDAPENEEQAQRERQAFPRRVPAVLRLLRGLHIVRVRQEVNFDMLEFHFVAHRKDWIQWLEALPILVKEALKNIVTQEQTRETLSEGDVGEVDAQSLLLAVQDVAKTAGQEAEESYEISFSISHLQVILRFLRDLGYLRRADTFVPMALEVQVTDPSSVVLGDTGRDAKILRQFEEQKQMRMLRLAALQAIPDLVSDRKRLQEFVEQRYFQVTSPQELMVLLEENLSAENEILCQLREDALRELLDGNPDEEKPGLSDQQRAVYDAPLDCHLMVVAGPGAGKTHTLLARLVRLVHTVDVRANDILVLAFTRAVVSELRYRLQDLLGRLGYGTLARGIHVTTFHSFVLGTLREFRLIQDDFRLDDKDWFKKFVRLLQENPALRLQVATRYRYVFVDEFQDVHGARYSLLEYLAEGRQTYLLVVGDDDQSIYDYERVPGEGNATQYFRSFEDHFNPMRFDLTRNYRSAKAIVDFSQDIVATLPDRLKDNQSLKPYRYVHGMAEWRQGGTNLVALVREVEQSLNASSDKRSQHNTIAILARTNKDVYRIKAHLQHKLGQPFTLLLQGQESRFTDRRDIAEMIDVLRDQYIGQRANESLEKLLRQQLSKPPFNGWPPNQPPEQHELWYLAQEFLAGAGHETTMADFIEYVREMSKNGNYLRVVARRQSAEGEKGRILLSTIHKVKGIEFPAVILLSSDTKVGDVDQELRVMYVGMTRAEDVLIALEGEREKRLLERRSFKPESRQRDELVVAPSLGDVFISKFGYEWKDQQLILASVRRGDKITLVRNKGRSNPFSIKHNNSRRYIGLLAGVRAKKSKLTRELMQCFGSSTKSFVGLEATGVYRRYTEQDKRHDEEHSSDFYERLCDKVKAQGHK